jgi:excinuclease ABC subunit A
MSLEEVTIWISSTIKSLPAELQQIAIPIYEEFLDNANSLLELGLGYLTLDRPSSTLSTGELQRVPLARTVRNQTTGILYVLDEPSIGLHPANIDGLIKLVHKLNDDGNSIIVVDHDTRILRIADYLIEIGPSSGSDGGNIISQGSINDVMNDENSIIGPYISDDEDIIIREKITKDKLFDNGIIKLSTDKIHTVKELDLKIPKGRFNVVTGVSGSGKTTLILESLYPAIFNTINNEKLPDHIKSIDSSDIEKIYLIDSAPIGKNVRSTLATYSGVFTPIRKLYAKLDKSVEKGYTLKDFSYNTGSLRCPTCNGTGQINMDVQFLPDVEITCPDCDGLRFSDKCDEIKYNNYSIKDLMALTIDESIAVFTDEKKIFNKLKTLSDMGLGYLTLGEATPALSGGEAQRLKLSSQIDKKQDNSLFIFDEPTIGLHPKDVKKLIKIFDKLLQNNATIIVIEHDLDLIKNADYIIDMGPKGGVEGGRIIAEGTLDDIIHNKESITAKYLK